MVGTLHGLALPNTCPTLEVSRHWLLGKANWWLYGQVQTAQQCGMHACNLHWYKAQHEDSKLCYQTLCKAGARVAWLLWGYPLPLTGPEACSTGLVNIPAGTGQTTHPWQKTYCCFAITLPSKYLYYTHRLLLLPTVVGEVSVSSSSYCRDTKLVKVLRISECWVMPSSKWNIDYQTPQGSKDTLKRETEKI